VGGLVPRSTVRQLFAGKRLGGVDQPLCPAQLLVQLKGLSPVQAGGIEALYQRLQPAEDVLQLFELCSITGSAGDRKWSPAWIEKKKIAPSMQSNPLTLNTLHCTNSVERRKVTNGTVR
jgi:hypothetical protein